MSTDAGRIPADFYFGRADKHGQKSAVIFRAADGIPVLSDCLSLSLSLRI